MKNIINKKHTIDENVPDIFVTEEDIDWNGIQIFKNSLLAIDNNYIYVNETPLNFYSLFDYQYGEELIQYKKVDSFIIKNDNKEENSDETIIRNGEMVRWHNGRFSNRCIPLEIELLDLPTFNYKGVDYSNWGYRININSKEIEDGFYKKDGKYFEMTGEGLEDIEVK